MSLGIIRIRALQVLADRIGNCVPELKGRICGGQAEAPKRQGFPFLNIRSIRHTYNPDQATYHCRPTPANAVFNVGRVEATVQLTLGAATARRRYELEQMVLERVFLADLDRPGVVLLDVPDCYNARVAFELDASEWQDEAAFDKKWLSVATVALQMPALVNQGGVYNIEELRLALSEDLNTEFDDLPESSMETVAIDEDGQLTPAANP